MSFNKDSLFNENTRRIDAKFLFLFPNSFEDKEWLKLNKKHSIQAIDNIFTTSLSKAQMKTSIEEGHLEDIILACKTAVQKSTTISMFEKMAFRNYMLDESLHKEFAQSLYNVLYVNYKKYFSEFTYLLTKTRNSISNSNCAKWAIVSFFLAYSNKDYHVFLKPTSAKNVSIYFKTDIQYQAYPNLETYEKFRDIIIEFKKQSKLTQNKDNIISQVIIFCALSIMHE
jgi:hypothetical protein